MYKPGGTIADASRRIQDKGHVFQAIYLDFVWKHGQVELL